jgi:hypothetical protein
METTSGQKAQLTIKPALSVKILSPSKDEVDLEKDLTVKFKNPPGCENTGIHLYVFSKPTVTQNGWTGIDYFKSADQITIPAAIVLHSRGGFKVTDSYLLAERYSLETPEVPGIGEVRLLSLAWDYSPFKAKNLGSAPSPTQKEKDGVSTATGAGISINSKEGKGSDAKMAYNIHNYGYATNIRPLKQAKKLAVIGFTVRATALNQEQTHNWTTTNTSVTYEEHYDHTNKITTTTTTNWSETVKKQFPEFPKEYWDNLTEELYKGFEQSMKAQGIEIIPVEKVLQSVSYKDFPGVPDTLTVEAYSSSYKGLKNIFGGGFTKSVLASAFGSPQRRLMKELGVDGTVTVNVDMAMPWEAKTTLMPKFDYSILGNVNGYETFPCAYAQGSIRGDGVDIKKLTETKEVDEVKTSTKDGIVTEVKTGKKKKAQYYTHDALEQVIRKDEIYKELGESLSRMKDEEDKSGYFNELWKLKY